MAKQVLLDTSFILTSIKNKIDFLDEISSLGLTPLIPKQVMVELEGITNGESKLALKILKKNEIKMIDLETKNTDYGIIAYAKKNIGLVVATLDREIKNAIKNNKLIIRGKKNLEII